jgi:hypothetical protein
MAQKPVMRKEKCMQCRSWPKTIDAGAMKWTDMKTDNFITP